MGAFDDAFFATSSSSNRVNKNKSENKCAIYYYKLCDDEVGTQEKKKENM